MSGFSPFLEVLVVLLVAGIYLTVYHLRPTRSGEKKRGGHFSPSATHSEDRGFGFYRWIDLYLKISTLLVVVAALVSSHWLLFSLYNQPILAYLGLVTAAAGLGLFLWSMRCLGKQFSPCNRARRPEKIVSHGPYRWVRHPIYTANLLLLAGLFLLTASAWLLLNFAILNACYQWSARREEQHLRQHFPEYQAYYQRTGRFLPKLHWDRWRWPMRPTQNSPNKA